MMNLYQLSGTKSREWGETAGNDGNLFIIRRTTTVRKEIPHQPREKRLLIKNKITLLLKNKADIITKQILTTDIKKP